VKASTGARAVLLAALVAGVCGLLHWLGVGFAILLALAVLVGLVAMLVPWLGVRGLDALLQQFRALRWRREEGRHHAFAGIALHIVDDGRFVWIAGRDLQRVLRTADADDVFAARHPGRWRHSDDGELLLRVDAVVERLASCPGRLDPRILRLRQYFERDVLFPAHERRRRGGAA